MEADSFKPNEHELSPMLTAINAPISGKNPAGEDVTYDDDFQRMKAEVDQIASASSTGVDFKELARLGEIILASKSKDLRVAAFFVMALERTRGLSGLAEGLLGIEMLIDNYWDEMYPPLKRIAGRQNALQSMSDRVKDWIASRTPDADDRQHLERALESVRRLQTVTMERMGERAPAISGLSQAIEELLRKAPRPAHEEEATTASDVRAAKSATTVQARTPEVVTATSSDGTLSDSDLERSLLQIARILTDVDRSDPLAYRLTRMAMWGRIDAEPPSENARTMIPPPDEQRFTYLQGLLERKELSALVTKAEDEFVEMPLWLDLQRMVGSALDGLGHSAARNAVVIETWLLLKRIPGLMKLCFSDGTPMAAAATRTWYEVQTGAMVGVSPNGTNASAGDGGQLDAIYQKAREELGEGDLPAAVALLQQKAAKDGSGESSFRRRLMLGRLLLDGGRPAVARPILEGLTAEFDRYDLRSWNPALAFETGKALYRCYTELEPRGGQEDIVPSKTRIFNELCRLDPEGALELDSI